MNLQLNGKSALVTGSTAGIGLAIATALAKEGAQAIVNGRSDLRVKEAMRASGATDGIAADLGSDEGARYRETLSNARHPGEQRRHFRTKALRRNPR